MGSSHTQHRRRSRWRKSQGLAVEGSVVDRLCQNGPTSRGSRNYAPGLFFARPV